MYIDICREREPELNTYIYIYMYIHTHTLTRLDPPSPFLSASAGGGVGQIRGLLDVQDLGSRSLDSEGPKYPKYGSFDVRTLAGISRRVLEREL